MTRDASARDASTRRSTRPGRPREFDADVALERAMDLFWERGYEATGVADLVERLGIGRGSLYAAFGDKAQLYRAALARYRARAGALCARLDEPGPVLPALRALLEGLVEEDCADPLRRGCMVVNAAVERVPADPDTTRQVAEQLIGLEDALHAALRRGQATGEVDPDRDARALARFLVATIQGLRVVGKVTPDRAALREAVDVALAAVTPAAAR